MSYGFVKESVQEILLFPVGQGNLHIRPVPNYNDQDELFDVGALAFIIVIVSSKTSLSCD